MSEGRVVDPSREPSEESARLRARASQLVSTGPRLRAFPVERIARAFASAARFILDPEHAVGREARARLPDATGLSPQMIEWALRTTLGPVDADALRLIARRRVPSGVERSTQVPARLAVVVLAGNVFTAAMRAVLHPLLAGVPTLAKASSRDDVFPRLLAVALAEADAEVAESYDVVSLPRENSTSLRSIFAEADFVSVYGSDATIAEIRAELSVSTHLVAHGHGLGVIFVAASAVSHVRKLEELTKRIALDVAAYDQRGCLSPHAVFLERNANISGPLLARSIAENGLAELRDTLPRGALPVESGAAQVQWRGVAAARGELFEGDGFATSYEGTGALRLSPGWRNVAVLDCDDMSDLGARLSSLGTHLKALGVAGDLDVRKSIAASLPPPLAPRISPVGTMQTPPIDALADGDSPWLGLTRWIEIE